MTDEILQAALEWLLQEQSRIDRQLSEIRSLLNRSPSSTGSKPTERSRGRRQMSAEARKRISDAQKKRWSAARKRTGAKKKS